MKRFIYADNAATTKLDMGAFEAMKPYLLDEYGNASQPYSFSRTPKKALHEARQIIASCINADPNEIYFTSGGTESDNWAIKAIALAQGKHHPIITSQIEHHAILRACHAVEQMGCSVTYLPVDSCGVVQPESLSSIISSETKLVSVMYANNEIGTIEPIPTLCSIAHEHGVLFHTDAVQAVGHVHIDVKALGIDMLSASAHKFNGPKGIGFLYIKSGVPVFPYADGGAQEFGMRAGTENIASIVAMADALQKNCRRIDEVTAHLVSMEKNLLNTLQEAGLDFIRNGSSNHIPGNISLSFKDAQGEMLLHRLDLLGVSVSTGSACDGKITQVSHVIEAIQVPKEYRYGTIRISLGYENTVEEVRYIATAIAKILQPHKNHGGKYG